MARIPGVPDPPPAPLGDTEAERAAQVARETARSRRGRAHAVIAAGDALQAIVQEWNEDRRTR